MKSDRVTDRRFAAGFNVPSAVIALQMTLSVLLLIPCGLFVRSWWQGAAVDPGFSPAQVVLLPVSTKQAGLKVQKPEGFEQQLADRIALRPGVEAVTLMDPVPLSFGGNTAHFEILNSSASRTATANLLFARRAELLRRAADPPAARPRLHALRHVVSSARGDRQRDDDANTVAGWRRGWPTDSPAEPRDRDRRHREGREYLHLGETSTAWLVPAARAGTDR